MNIEEITIDDELFPVEGFEGLYSITRDGRIWTKRRQGSDGRWIKAQFDKDGYRVITLCKNGKYTNHKLHRLIAKKFILNPLNKPEINHLNGIKDDNRIINLNWVTSKENDLHARKKGLTNTSGEDNGSSKLTWEQVDEIRKYHIPRNGITKRKPWEKYGIKYAQYREIVANRSWIINEVEKQ